MSDRPTIAIFGGSFNPVHVGHVGIARALATTPGISGVIVVPTRRSPFKREVALLPDDLRWAMLREALHGTAGVTLSDVELRRPPPSYTVHTLHTLAALLPAARLCLALGWDAFADFARWFHAEEILGLAGLLVFHREGATPPDQARPDAWPALLPPAWGNRARPVDDDRLLDDGGRELVRRVPIPVPAVAGRDILGTHDLTDVPPGARELLATHWDRQEGR